MPVCLVHQIHHGLPTIATRGPPADQQRCHDVIGNFPRMTAGDLGRAIPLYEQTLADRERVLGADHPQTKTVRANLAVTRQHHQ
jgi:hypothetical protein